MKSLRFLGPAFFFVLMIAIGIWVVRLTVLEEGERSAPTAKTALPKIPDAVLQDHYLSEIQPIFNNRCVACHSCYNSPCQLNLGSYEGFSRGASKVDPYDFPMTEARPPTRLGVDAQTVKGWREKGFFAVHGVAAQLLTAKNQERATTRDVLSKIEYSPESSRSCPSNGDEAAEFLRKEAFAGMPYGFPSIGSDNQRKLLKWLADGGNGPTKEALKWFEEPQTELAKRAIQDWEGLLNGSSLKERLSARYLFEHLHVAHIAFSMKAEEHGREFFRLIRAKNREGAPIEIPTVRPFDDPGPKFYYRFKKIGDAIVSKTHTVFILSDLERTAFERDFLKSEWPMPITKMPAYGDTAANAFEVFQAIPRSSRYRFFLDHARYFIMTFMKGPVCRGQTALNVIDDHFWVMFLDPKFDQSAQDNATVAKMEKLLDPPATIGDKLKVFNNLRERRWRANTLKTREYIKQKTPFAMSAIWNGEGSNPNALLTVYRHFDSSDVRWGAEGENPKTVWVMDYQIFEDIYYNLVAGYNLYGPILHQLNTRLYMEISRISSQDMFLNFLPQDQRAEIRKRWSHDGRRNFKEKFTADVLSIFGKSADAKMSGEYAYPGAGIETALTFESKNPQAEFLQRLFKERLAKQVEAKPDLLSRPSAERPLLNMPEKDDPILTTLKKMSGKPGLFAVPFPDVSFIRVHTRNGEKLAYSIVHNKEHSNVSLIFFESLRREPENDSLNIVPGFAASYPNYYFEVREDQLDDFVRLALAAGQPAVSDEELADLEKSKRLNPRMDALAKRFGVSRHRADFWILHDWFNEEYLRREPLEAGLLDLNRYLN